MAGCPSGVPPLAAPLRMAGRTGSAPLPPLVLVVVSASGGEGGEAPSSGPSGFRRWGPSPLRTLSGGCLSLHWQAWRDTGAEPWVVCPSSALLLFHCSHPNAFFQPHLHHGGCPGGGHLGLNCHGCYGACSTPFSSHLFIVWKTSRSWRPVIDLSHLIRFVDVSPFQMVPIQSVLLAVRQGDWMASIGLMAAYLKCRFLSFSSLSSLLVQ